MWQEISPEEADLLISCGAAIEYSHVGIEDSWYGWQYKDWSAVDYYNTPPLGGVLFRVHVE